MIKFVLMKTSLAYFFFLLIAVSAFSQTDTKFWFAVPEVTSRHADRPVKLHVSAFDVQTKVTISIPSNELVDPLVFIVSENETYSIDIIDEFVELGLLENNTPNIVVNKGLLIESEQLISVYYEVLGTGTYGVVNTDIFTLKGSNSLGTEFFTPFQTSFDNFHFGNSPDAWSSIDVVATEDNTSLTITPVTDVYAVSGDILAYTPITITLNRGQTYSVRNASQLAENSLSGSHLVSNKPIAVTVKDDSVLDETRTSYDLVGDQLVPVRMLGTEYVTGGGFIYIVAIDDNTELTITYNNDLGEESVISSFVDKGETFSVTTLTDKPEDNPFQITSSAAVNVFVMKSLGKEYGGAIIPTVTCTGSRRVSLANTAEETLIFEVVTKVGNEAGFVINKEPFVFDNSDIIDGWFYGFMFLDPADYPLYEAIVVENTSGDFHLGVMNGGYDTGLRFGYFSDFGTLELGSDRAICEGDSAILNAGVGGDTYLWSQIGNPAFTSDQQIIVVKKTGEYVVDVKKGLCESSDTIVVTVNPNVTPIDLGTENKFCEGDSIILSAPSDATIYLWQDGSTNSTFVVKQTDDYSLSIANEFGCSDTSSISITEFFYPVLEIPAEVTICESDVYTVTLDPGYDSYKWYEENILIDETVSSYTFTEEGLYSVAVSNYCGYDSTSFNLEFWHIEIPNVITPNNDGKNDQFFITGIEQGVWGVSIYNRWGEAIYENESFQNDWITTKEEGTYFYYLTHDDDCNEFKGWLYIIGDN